MAVTVLPSRAQEVQLFRAPITTHANGRISPPGFEQSLEAVQRFFISGEYIQSIVQHLSAKDITSLMRVNKWMYNSLHGEVQGMGCAIIRSADYLMRAVQTSSPTVCLSFFGSGNSMRALASSYVLKAIPKEAPSIEKGMIEFVRNMDAKDLVRHASIQYFPQLVADVVKKTKALDKSVFGSYAYPVEVGKFLGKVAIEFQRIRPNELDAFLEIAMETTSDWSDSAKARCYAILGEMLTIASPEKGLVFLTEHAPVARANDQCLIRIFEGLARELPEALELFAERILEGRESTCPHANRALALALSTASVNLEEESVVHQIATNLDAELVQSFAAFIGLPFASVSIGEAFAPFTQVERPILSALLVRKWGAERHPVTTRLVGKLENFIKYQITDKEAKQSAREECVRLLCRAAEFSSHWSTVASAFNDAEDYIASLSAQTGRGFTGFHVPASRSNKEFEAVINESLVEKIEANIGDQSVNNLVCFVSSVILNGIATGYRSFASYFPAIRELPDVVRVPFIEKILGNEQYARLLTSEERKALAS